MRHHKSYLIRTIRQAERRMRRSEGGRQKGGIRMRLGEERGRGTKKAWMDSSTRVIIHSNKLSCRGKNDIRLLITPPCAAHVCICMHFLRKPSSHHKSFSDRRGSLHVFTPVILFLGYADLWILAVNSDEPCERLCLYV